MVRRGRVASVISEECGERADGPFNTLEGKLDMAQGAAISFKGCCVRIMGLVAKV
jgi:hypothetical protein